MTKIKPLLVCLILAFSNLILAQDFQINSIQLSAEQTRNIDDRLPQWKAFTINLSSLEAYVQQQKGSFPLQLEIGEQKLDLQLQNRSIFAENCMITIPNGEDSFTVKKRPQSHTYQGHEGLSADNRARFFISAQYLHGTIKKEGLYHQIKTLRSILGEHADPNTFVLITSPIEKSILSCGTGRIFDGDEYSFDRFLRIGAEIDHAFYNKYKGSNPDYYESNALSRMELSILRAEDIYDFYFDLCFEVIHVNLWSDVADNYSTNDQSVFNQLKAKWNYGPLACIDRHVVHLFSGKNMYGDGASNSSTLACPSAGGSPTIIPNCPGQSFSYTDFHAGNDDLFYKTVAHEFAHGFSVGHLDVDPDQPCADLCNNANNAPIMCVHGAGDDVDKFTSGSQGPIIARITQFTDKFLDDQPQEACTPCFVSTILTVDNPQPTVGCESDNVVEFTLTVTNDCKAKTVDAIYLNWQSDEWELATPGDYGTFPSYLELGSDHQTRVDDLALEPFEQVVYTVKLRVIGANSNSNATVVSANTLYSLVNIARSSVDYASFYPVPLFQVDGTQNPAFVSQLIGTDLPPNNTPNQKLSIAGTLIVDIPYVFNNSDLTMEPGSEIIVLEDMELALFSTELGGCDQMWKGITVNENAEFISKNSKIQDAAYGITAHTQASLDINKTIFTNNYVGIRVPPSDNGEARPVFFENFYGNIFYGDRALLPTYTGQTAYNQWSHTGMLLDDLNEIHLTGFQNIEIGFNNVFHQLVNGIKANNTNLTIDHSKFSSISFSYGDLFGGYGIHATGDGDDFLSVEGAGAYNNESFKACDSGILSFGMNLDIHDNAMSEVRKGIIVQQSPNRTVNISDNFITADIFGIQLSNNAWLSGAIEDNRIDIHQGYGFSTAILLSESTKIITDWNIRNNLIVMYYAPYGIRNINCSNTEIAENTFFVEETELSGYKAISVETSNNVQVSCNLIEGNGVGKPGNYKGKGIYILHSPSSSISCNSITGTNVGINYYGNCGYENELKGNEFGLHQIGLLLGDFLDDASANGNVHISVQNHRGNRWPFLHQGYENTEYLGARNLASSGSPFPIFTIEPIIIDAAEDPHFYPSYLSSNPNWIQNESNDSPSYSCEAYNTCSGGVGVNLLEPEPTRRSDKSAKKEESIIEHPVLLHAYPNPAQQQLTIEFNTLSEQPTHIELYNNLGQKVYSTSIAPEQRQAQVDVSAYAPGTYSLIWRDQEKTLSASLLVIQR